MKKVFHKLRDYVLALLTLMAMSACSESLNTLGNSHFTKEGELREFNKQVQNYEMFL